MSERLLMRERRIEALAHEVAACLARRGEDTAWRDQAACTGVDPEIFFPERGQTTARATLVCNRCPVQIECLAWSVANGEKLGVWGGVAERTRRVIRRRLADWRQVARSA
ncbi:MAG TPA: WhiB family transcriptional regulator [Acidimicrobiales bacterium]|nr:WhiB family transcriptional regulator [Acidimicrobiales bacterium]